jgi:hypothetical protein
MQSPCLLNADALSAIVANGGLALPVSYRENALTPPSKISVASCWSRANACIRVIVRFDSDASSTAMAEFPA